MRRHCCLVFRLAKHDQSYSAKQNLEARMSDFGHNSGVETGGIAADRLRSIVERTERLESERKALSGDIKDIMAEAKSAGFCVKTIRQIIRLRRMEPAELQEQESLLDIYRRALGC